MVEVLQRVELLSNGETDAESFILVAKVGRASGLIHSTPCALQQGCRRVVAVNVCKKVLIARHQVDLPWGH